MRTYADALRTDVPYESLSSEEKLRVFERRTIDTICHYRQSDFGKWMDCRFSGIYPFAAPIGILFSFLSILMFLPLFAAHPDAESMDVGWRLAVVFGPTLVGTPLFGVLASYFNRLSKRQSLQRVLEGMSSESLLAALKDFVAKVDKYDTIYETAKQTGYWTAYYNTEFQYQNRYLLNLK